jgi:hypothetical protein
VSAVTRLPSCLVGAWQAGSASACPAQIISLPTHEAAGRCGVSAADLHAMFPQATYALLALFLKFFPRIWPPHSNSPLPVWH